MSMSALGSASRSGEDRVEMDILINSPLKEHTLSRSYGGPPLNALVGQ